MDKLVDAGVTEFVFIIGYLGDKIEQFLTEHYGKYELNFVIQTVGKGIGHAIWLAKDEIKDGEDILIVLGDTIFEADLKSAFVPASELPFSFNPGDQTQTLNSPGITAKIPPPTPLLPGSPTR